MTENGALAKIRWRDPKTGSMQEFVLVEGATATIGRSSSNDICIPEQHVSRQHAVITYREGMFMINDLDSANGTFVNNEKISDEMPLMAGDEIRLYVPTLQFLAADAGDYEEAEKTGTLITAVPSGASGGRLIVTNGPREGDVYLLQLPEVTIGRATSNADWEIALLDPAVSRPHAKIVKMDDVWFLQDLGSSNGTLVNNNPVSEKGRALKDGDIITMGATMLLFRGN